MRLLVLSLLVLSSCTKQMTTPQHAAPLPRNEAVQHAHTVSAGAACAPLSTAQPGYADSAFCDLGRVLAYCYSGVGLGAGCMILADLRPKQPTPEALKVPNPELAKTAEVLDAKHDTKKPEPKK